MLPPISGAHDRIIRIIGCSERELLLECHRARRAEFELSVLRLKRDRSHEGPAALQE